MNLSPINLFEPITLEEMSGIRLMNRTDTKYITTLKLLEQLLEMACAEYRIQEVNGVRNIPYHTLYYDTPDNRMFLEHQNGKKKRQKIRIRSYVNSSISFLEVKNKNNKGRTDKRRVMIESADCNIISYNDFLQVHSWYKPDELFPQIENRFFRITLVNRNMTERLTIDTGLQFYNLVTKQNYSLEQLSIIELKRDGNTPSPISKYLRQLRISPAKFSKYCMGIAFTNQTIKRNNFKSRIRNVERLSGINYQ